MLTDQAADRISTCLPSLLLPCSYLASSVTLSPFDAWVVWRLRQEVPALRSAPHLRRRLDSNSSWLDELGMTCKAKHLDMHASALRLGVNKTTVAEAFRCWAGVVGCSLEASERTAAPRGLVLSLQRSTTRQ